MAIGSSSLNTFSTSQTQKPEIRRVNPDQSFEYSEQLDAYRKFIQPTPIPDVFQQAFTSSEFDPDKKDVELANFSTQGEIIFNSVEYNKPLPKVFQEVFKNIDLNPDKNPDPEVFQQAFTPDQLDPDKKVEISQGLKGVGIDTISDISSEVLTKSARWSIKSLLGIGRDIISSIQDISLAPKKDKNASEKPMDQAKKAEALFVRKAYKTQEEARTIASQSEQTKIQEIMVSELGQAGLTEQDTQILKAPSLNKKLLETPANIVMLRIKRQEAQEQAAIQAKAIKVEQTQNKDKGKLDKNRANEQGPSSVYNTAG